MRRLRSPSWPVISTCTGASKPSASGEVGNVVGVAVGDQHRAADPLRRRVGERRAQGGEQLRAAIVGIAARRLDDSDLDIVERRRAAFRVRRAPPRSAAAARRSGSTPTGRPPPRPHPSAAGDPRAPTRDRRARRAAARRRAPAAPRRPAAATPSARRRPAPRRRARSSRHCGTGGEKAIDQAFNATAFPAGPWRGPGRPCSCRSACTSPD